MYRFLLLFRKSANKDDLFSYRTSWLLALFDSSFQAVSFDDNIHPGPPFLFSDDRKMESSGCLLWGGGLISQEINRNQACFTWISTIILFNQL